MLTSCQTYNYAPVPLANPMFTSKGQAEVQASLNIRHVQGQFSYSPIKNFSFTYGFSRVHKSIGMGSSHGLTLQHYGKFQKGGPLYYQVGMGLELGSLQNSRDQKRQTNGGTLFYNATAISKYYAPVFSAGIYTSLDDEQTQFGFEVSFTSVRYTLIDYTRIIQGDSGNYLWISVDNAGKIIRIPILASAFTIKHSSKKELLYFKWTFGYRLNETLLYLPNRIPGSFYQTAYAGYHIPDFILTFQLGVNLHKLKIAKR